MGIFDSLKKAVTTASKPPAAGHASKYKLMGLRNFIRPFSSFGSKFGLYAAIGGVIFDLQSDIGNFLLNIGIFLFAGAVLFSLLTLPAELNASARALTILRDNEMLAKDELAGAKKALNAAAMTYFAGACLQTA